ncbi:hypothetical protein DMH17_14710 [Raoultella planticola]|nr:hypothetical protein [Raoultella planticola]
MTTDVKKTVGLTPHSWHELERAGNRMAATSSLLIGDPEESPRLTKQRRNRVGHSHPHVAPHPLVRCTGHAEPVSCVNITTNHHREY